MTEDTTTNGAGRSAGRRIERAGADLSGQGAAEAFWEPHYRRGRVGRGGPNVRLAETVADRAPARALDLGCGDGGDAIWLAGRGWDVTTVDVSVTALSRVADRAADEGLGHRVHTEHHDLGTSFPAGRFDLVSAQYLLSPVEFARDRVFAAAAAALTPGGLLMVVDHGSVAPWSWGDPAAVFPTPQELLDSFGLDLTGLDVVRADATRREATGPGGHRATVTDTIVALQRRGRLSAAIRMMPTRGARR